jgi:hypothetical protein
MVRWYKEDNRTATVRTLNLTEAQAQAMARRLAINARPENAEYDYRHYLDNCCTRIRDLLDDVLGGAIKKTYAKKETGLTFRYWTRRALRGFPIYKNVILFSLGPTIDHPVTRWQEQFLPEVLVEDLDEMTVGNSGEPLVSKKTQIFKSTAPRVGTTFYVEDAVTAGLLFGLLIIGFGTPLLIKRPGVGRRLLGVGLVVWGLVGGLAGVMLALYWTITTHYDTHYNENLLVMPPTHLLLLGLGLRLTVSARLSPKTVAVLKHYLKGSLGLIAIDLILKIGPFIQGNFEFIAFAALCDAGALISLKRQFSLERPAKPPESESEPEPGSVPEMTSKSG